jgi:hypothetical protein
MLVDGELIGADSGRTKHSGIGRHNGLAGFDQYPGTKAVAWPTPA